MIAGRSLLCVAALIALALPPAWAQSPSLDGTPDDLPDTAFDEGGCARGEPGPPAWALNLATLQLSVEAIDFRSRGLGPEVRLRRAYWAAQDRAGMFGSVWQSDYEARITRSQDGAVLGLAGGHSVPFSGQLGDSPGTWLTTTVALTPADTSRYRLTYEGAVPAFVLDDPRTRWLWRFEQAGTGDHFRLASIADRYGNAITLAYESRDEHARLMRVVDAVGRTTLIGHDGGGRATTITAPDNRSASFTYDAAGRLTESTDFLGARTAYTYDGTSITTITTTGNRITRFEWSSTSPRRVTGIVDPLQARTAYALDEAMGRVTITTPLAFLREVEHKEGRRTRETDGWWREVRTEYTGGRPTRILDGSAETKFEYDPAGNVVKRTDPMGRSTTYTWNADGLLTHRTDATGATWRYEYDAQLSLREITTPLQVRTTFLYDLRGQLLRVTDAQQRFREFRWTGEGDLDTVIDRAGRVSSFTHDRYGRLLTQRLRTGGEPISFVYDANDRLVATRWAGGERRITYDGCLVSSTTNENGHATSFAWDARGRPMGAADPAGGSVQLTRDLDGRVTAIRDPLGRTSRTSLDRFARALELTDPANGVWRVDYDERGRLLRLTAPAGNRASQVWNLAGELTAAEDALGFEQGYNRDALGRVETAVTGANRRATFTYDADGRRSEVRHDTSVAHRSIYDTFGQLLQRDDAGLVTTFTYDAEGRTASATWNTGGLTSFAWDAGGRLGAITYPGGQNVTYAYDARERVRTVSIGGATSTFTYDAADRLVSIARPQAATSAFQWDAAGRATRVEHRSAAAGVFVDLAISRDLAGNVLAVTGTEPRPRLARVDVPPTTYNGAGQITTRDGVAYGYGAAGDLTSIASGVAWNAEYDPEHRLTSLTRNSQTVRFAWDADGRRIARDGREFHYGPDGTLLFESENGQLARSYVYADGRLFAMVEAGAIRYFHFDHLGSTLALTDASGALVGTWGYDPSGRATAGAGSPPLLFTFVGEFGVQAESGGLYVMGPRVYDSATMRFIQRHPGGLAAGPQVYEYAGGNPTSLVAPDGLSGRLPTATAFGAGGGAALAEAARTYARYAGFTAGTDLASAAMRVQDAVARQVPFLERFERRGEPITLPGLDLWQLWGLLR